MKLSPPHECLQANYNQKDNKWKFESTLGVSGKNPYNPRVARLVTGRVG